MSEGSVLIYTADSEDLYFADSLYVSPSNHGPSAGTKLLVGGACLSLTVYCRRIQEEACGKGKYLKKLNGQIVKCPEQTGSFRRVL